MALDLVVRGGMVMDGSGGPRYRSDVGVSDGRITAIGRIRERAATEIDADGHVVAPGFIDGHTHLDAQMHWDRLGESSCWHGVTTVLMGNCGFTLAPCRAEEADLVFRSLEQAEEIPRHAMLEGIDWQWKTMPEYLDVVDRLPKGINYAVYVGHSSLRAYVMGERGTGPVETMIDLALESDFDQLFGRKLLNFDLDSLGEVLRHPRPVIGVSDTGAHVKRVADSSYPTRFLADWVRARQAFEWEEGIRMLTSVPAQRYGFTDRGHIREGLAADLVVFDPETVGPRLPTVGNDFPTGALRLQQKATGMAATVVNGQIHLRDGEPTGAVAGRLLRGPLASG